MTSLKLSKAPGNSSQKAAQRPAGETKVDGSSIKPRDNPCDRHQRNHETMLVVSGVNYYFRKERLTAGRSYSSEFQPRAEWMHCR